MGEQIIALLRELRPEHNFENSIDFIEDDLLDSFDIISLVSMLEEKYNIIIDALEITPENFQNINAVEKLVRKSKGND